MLHFQKLIGFFCAALLAASMFGQRNEPEVSPHPNNQFKQYKAIEAYEIRPGILMMPRYSPDGQVCEIGLEKNHYSPTKISLDSELTRKEIDEIADEFAPPDQRGPKSNILAGSNELISMSGQGMVTTSDYQNVSIEIYASILKASGKQMTVEELVAVIRWKHRKCE
jgi:hypothetical protein